MQSLRVWYETERRANCMQVSVRVLQRPFKFTRGIEYVRDSLSVLKYLLLLQSLFI